MVTQDVLLETTRTYEKYFQKTGPNRNSLLQNPEVLFQMFAADRAMILAVRSTKAEPRVSKVLDVGCGDGASLLNFIRLGFPPSNLTGLDIRVEEVRRGTKMFPNVTLVCGNAQKMQFPSESFDIVTETGMFTQMLDQELAAQITQEMVRVVKRHAFIILADWRYNKPWSMDYAGLSLRRIRELFHVSSATEIHRVWKGALVPPVGRWVSKRIPCLYFALQTFCPFLVGGLAVVLRKK